MADLEPTRTVYEESAASFVDAIGTAISTEVEHATDIERLREFARRCPHGAGPVLDAGCGAACSAGAVPATTSSTTASRGRTRRVQRIMGGLRRACPWTIREHVVFPCGLPAASGGA